MAPSEKYVRACYPDRWKILGRRMQDFTPAHAELLDSIGYNADGIEPADLLAAVRICSLPRKKAKRYVGRGGRKLLDLLWLTLFWFDRELFRHTAAAFKNYLDTANETPDFWADNKSTRPSTCPTLLMLKRDLMHHYGYTADQVANMPMGQAQWERLAILEADGSLDFKTDEDVELIEEAKRIAREEFEASQKQEEVANGNR